MSGWKRTYNARIYGDREKLISAHNWTIENFGESYNWETGAIERWQHGYHDDGYLSVSFRYKKDYTLFCLMWC